MQQRFALNTSQLYLTYPECDIDKVVMYDYLYDKFQPDQILVAHELHANGHSHLHAYLKLKGPLRTYDPRFADYVNAEGRVYHGNYQGCRSSKNVIKYCSKEDDVSTNMDLTAILAKRSSRREHMEELINRKRTLEEMLKDQPQYLFNYQSLTNSLKAYFEKVDVPNVSLPIWLPNPWGKLLPVKKEEVKRRHYHIFSSGPNAGKTTWATSICDEYGGIIVSNREPYWNVFPGLRFIFLDEFNTARHRFDELNAMADGTYGYRRCGSGVFNFPKGSRPIIVILSNISLSTLYPFMHDTLYARFNIVDVSNYKFI
ncbi:replication associated protein [Chifec virus UA13_133]|nr:replication associated protein [Chifec virus UA13_133]